MARQPNLANPLVGLRRSLRDLRDGRLAEDPRRSATRDSVEIALFRLPPRQREIVRRFDLSGEPAAEIQRVLGISPRQFFRDRRAALTKLRTHVPYLTTLRPSAPVPAAEPSHPTITDVCDVTLSRRAFARSLAQTGNAQCLRVLHELAWSVTDPNARADLLLELAELALDYDDDESARNAVNSVARILGAGEPAPGLAEYFAARLARANARLTEPWPQASLKFSEAVAWLRRSAAASPNAIETYVALFETLGDMTLLEFEAGNFASARAASGDAVRIIESFGLRTRPRAL